MSLDMLPPVVELLKLPPSEQKRYIIGFRQHVDCNGFLFFIQKLINWCAYLKTLPPDHIERLDAASGVTTEAPRIWTGIPNDSKQYFSWLLDMQRGNDTVAQQGGPTYRSYGHSFSCYDDYFCDSPSISIFNFGLMGVFALVFCLFAVTAYTMLIPVFNLAGIRSTATVFMNGIAVCDLLTLILITLIVVVKNLHLDYQGQLETYKSFSGYLVPAGIPIKELLEMLSLWLVLSLLVDRYVYVRRGVRMTRLINRSRFVRVLSVLLVFFVVYTAPKFLRYKLEDVITKEGNHTGHVKVLVTRIARTPLYQTLMMSLKLSLEIVIPYLTIFILVVIIGCSLRRSGFTYDYNAKSSMLTREKLELRENTNTLIAFKLGILVLICKLPLLVLHVLSASAGIELSGFQQITLLSELLDLMSVALKPIIFLKSGPHLRHALQDMLCLFIRPGKTRQLVLAGGLGSTVKITRHRKPDLLTHSSTCSSLLTQKDNVEVSSLSPSEAQRLNEAVVQMDAMNLMNERNSRGSSSGESADTSSETSGGSSGDASMDSHRPLMTSSAHTETGNRSRRASTRSRPSISSNQVLNSEHTQDNEGVHIV